MFFCVENLQASSFALFVYFLVFGIDLFEFGISTVQCTTWEDPNDIDT